ncbi:MAG: DUF2442 domain-containing protein [Bacteroidota bacterium]
MQYEFHNIKSFCLTASYTLEIIFDDNTHKVIDFSPVLYGEMYGPLKNSALFNKVALDKEVHTLVWPNGADFNPSLLYHWEQHIDELSARAKKW